LLSLPYLQGSDDYLYKVIQNKKQTLIFGSFFSVGNVQVYLPLLMTAMIYIRFCAYRKINTDLLYAVTGVLFSTFLLLIEPSPGWYVWMTPFITIFYIRYSDGMQNYFLYGALASLYLLYYLAFYQYEHSKLLYLGEIFIISVPESELPLANIVFTGLQAILLATVYQFYKSGIESNNTYEMQQSFVIGIGGDSGSGKSTLIKQLKGIFSHQLLELEGDSDHKWERDNDNWQQYTHLDPKANTLHRQADQVQLLKNRKSIQRSDYNHDTGKFSEEDTIRPKNFIVLAGLHPFYLPKMRKIIDIKIFLNLDERLRTSWKVQRDQLHRGYTELEVLASIEKRQQDSTRYIQPQKRFSDLTIAFSPTQPDQFEGSIYHGELGLTIEMNASIPLDRVIQAFQKLNCDIVWDYSEDLSHQVVRFNSEPKKLDMNWFVNKYIANAADLINEPIWQTGYAGVTQFIIFYAISEMMKDRRLSNV
jgi:uridine kinase